MILVGEPLERRQSPMTLVDGQFSMPFLAAVMLRQGSFGWSDFGPHLTDPTTLAFCRVVTPVPDVRVEPPATKNFAATVQVPWPRLRLRPVVTDGEDACRCSWRTGAPSIRWSQSRCVTD
jgi:hypothetical protein